MTRAGTCTYQKDVLYVSEKIVLTSDAPTADQVTITDADAEVSSTPHPVEPDSGEPEECDSSSDEETTVETWGTLIWGIAQSRGRLYG